MSAAPRSSNTAAYAWLSKGLAQCVQRSQATHSGSSEAEYRREGTLFSLLSDIPFLLYNQSILSQLGYRIHFFSLCRIVSRDNTCSSASSRTFRTCVREAHHRAQLETLAGLVNPNPENLSRPSIVSLLRLNHHRSNEDQKQNLFRASHQMVPTRSESAV